ncbi:ribosome rescue GTPase HflX [Alloalcanivorax mobilis]|uniref:ribosome rescue GTPase HflX n=1 Tax=Alloalcanivorax mobilis TaxID=2019569 RepID=UPI000B5B2A28|nr:ribosome rescue GTPase HflX [Alloalcanivorax mobilis]ASK35427.1 GTPase HflX [Alcanivorax sp. N3-2A]|tara:strand:- start:26087 stop:27454 length:1368 start_codon:yes stop_codon:yes gene_type:complete
MDLFDRTEQARTGVGERAVLVHIDLPDAVGREDLDEFHHLVTSAGVIPEAQLLGKRDRPDPALFIGSGKSEELAALVRESEADVVLFNHSLSPAQERNLERAVKCRVLDRTGLILDIFAQRAATHEGRLQVELAQLRHLSTRLVRGWTHLERQKGGIGLRGPGETQLETDRRLLRDRIRAIEARLEKVRKQRAQGRRARDRSETPLISLVGYTNAGKSTLFNALTTGDVYVADQLFATLDPTLRKVRVPGVGPAILADTVGFIRHLPHRLVQAFRATLEETVNASLLLHVTDSSVDERSDNVAAVEEVLTEIGAEQVPVLHVYNKVDRLGMVPHIERNEEGLPWRVWISAQTGEGFELLFEAIAERLADRWVDRWLRLPPEAGRLRSRLHEAGEVLAEEAATDGGMLLRVHLNRVHFERLLREAGLREDQVRVPDPSVADTDTPSYNPERSHRAG